MTSKKQLFSVFNLPEAMVVDENTISDKNKKSYLFDFETGDFSRDGGCRVEEADNRMAWVQWCRKCILTERYAHIAYSGDIGIEFEMVRKQPNRKAMESALEKTITEALRVHPMTESVRNFKYIWEGDNLITTFDIYPRDGFPVSIETQLTI